MATSKRLLSIGKPIPTKTSDVISRRSILKSELDVIAVVDHSISHTVVTATALGASVLRSTLLWADPRGLTMFFAEPTEFLEMSNRCKECFSIGKISFPTNADLEQRSIFTRQLWSKVDIKKGDVLSWENVQSVRAPSLSGGAPSKTYKKVIGFPATKKIPKHSPILRDQIGDRK